ncbi:MAG: DUF87 domain-containing protein [Thermoplasmata archaeon]
MTGAGAVEGPGWLRMRGRYVAPLLIREFPREVPFGFLGGLCPTSEALEVLLEAHPIGSGRALELLHGARAVAEAELAHGGDGDDRSAQLHAERESAQELGHQVARREQELWRVGLRFAAVASSEGRAERTRMGLERRLAALGFRARVPRYAVREALAAPGLTGSETRPAGYWQTLQTDGLAAFYPFVDETVLEPGGVLVGLLLQDAAPVFLDRWSHASHSWGIFGATGSGKTFATALTLLRTRWTRPEVGVVLLDPLGEFGGFVRALGGTVLSFGPESEVRLNPLDPISTGGDRTEKAGRVGAILRTLFPSLRDEESAVLDAAVSRLYDRGPEIPVFSDLLAEVERGPTTERLRALLEPFRSGSLQAVNGPTSVNVEANVVSVDFRGIPEDYLPFHLAYVLDWAYGRLRDRPGPKLLVIDEAHLLVRHGATAEFLDRIVRHVRHFQGGVMVLSQHPDDFLLHASGRSLLGNLHATFLLRLTHIAPEARAFFGLTDAEAEWIPRARLPREAGYSEGLLRLGDLHLPIALVASTPEYEFLIRVLASGSPSEGPASAPPAPRL